VNCSLLFVTQVPIFDDKVVEIDRLFEQLSQDGQVLMELFQRPLVKKSVFPGN
jgi:hypothetical protein